MDYTHLGRTGLMVSRLALGTMKFGSEISEPDSHIIMDRAQDLGINFFETANGYGGPGHAGLTESVLGAFFALGGGRRERTVLATTVFTDMGRWPNEGRLSALNIRRALDASLRRSRTDYIDLYQFDHVDRTTPWEEIWQAVEVAVAQGKILYCGSSNFAGWHIAQAQEAALARHFNGLVSHQSDYNLIERSVELEILPAAQHYGLGVLPRSPLRGGRLSGVTHGAASRHRDLEQAAAQVPASDMEQIRQYEYLAAEIGHTTTEVALAWLLHQPAVTAPIISPATPAQLTAAVGATSVTLDLNTLSRLDDIFPGYRPAPEGYSP